MGAIPTKTELIDIAYRAWWTFVAVLVGQVATVGVENLTLQTFKAMAIAAAFTTLKSYLSNKNGTGTATERTTPIVGPQPVASLSATPASP